MYIYCISYTINNHMKLSKKVKYFLIAVFLIALGFILFKFFGKYSEGAGTAAAGATTALTAPTPPATVSQSAPKPATPAYTPPPCPKSRGIKLEAGVITDCYTDCKNGYNPYTTTIDDTKTSVSIDGKSVPSTGKKYGVTVPTVVQCK